MGAFIATLGVPLPPVPALSPTRHSLHPRGLAGPLAAPNARGYVLALLAGSLHAMTFAPANAADSPASSASRPVTEVVVESQRLPVENLVDRKVYNLSGDIRSEFGTVSDVLVAIPSVDVGIDGSVSLRGDSSVLILLDEQPLAQVSGPFVGEALRQIPADDIEKIEVITNPPAQYKAEGAAGIINIVTRKSRREGLTGSANANGGNSHRSSVGANARYGSSALGIFGGFTLREEDRQTQATSDRTVPQLPGEASLLTHSQFNQDLHRAMPSARAGMSYDFNDAQSMRVYISRGGRTGRIPSTNQSQSALAGGQVSSLTERDGVDQLWSMDSDQRVSFDQKLAREDEHLSVSLHHGLSSNRDTYAYTDLAYLPIAAPRYSHSLQRVDLASTDLNADYSLPLAKDESLRAGLSFRKDNRSYVNSSDTMNALNDTAVGDPSLTNDFRYRQLVRAAYVSYENTVWGWNVLGGLRLERTSTNAEQRTPRQLTLRSYAQLFPSLHLERSLPADATLTFSATRRISRPDAGSLNPYVDHSDPQNLRSGNPYLLPQLSRAYELGYSIDATRIVYSVTGYLRRNFNGITDVAQAVTADTVLVTRTNLPLSSSSGLELSANGRLLPALRFGLSGNLFHNQVNSFSLGAGLRTTTGLNGKASLDYHASAFDTLQLSFTHSAGRLTPQGSQGPSNQTNAGYKRQIRFNLLAVATLTDVFNGQGSRRITQAASFTDITQQHVQGRAIALGLVYNFGWRKARKAVVEEQD